MSVLEDLLLKRAETTIVVEVKEKRKRKKRRTVDKAPEFAQLIVESVK